MEGNDFGQFHLLWTELIDQINQKGFRTIREVMCSLERSGPSGILLNDLAQMKFLLSWNAAEKVFVATTIDRRICISGICPIAHCDNDKNDCKELLENFLSNIADASDQSRHAYNVEPITEVKIDPNEAETILKVVHSEVEVVDASGNGLTQILDFFKKKEVYYDDLTIYVGNDDPKNLRVQDESRGISFLLCHNFMDCKSSGYIRLGNVSFCETCATNKNNDHVERSHPPEPLEVDPKYSNTHVSRIRLLTLIRKASENAFPSERPDCSNPHVWKEFLRRMKMKKKGPVQQKFGSKMHELFVDKTGALAHRYQQKIRSRIFNTCTVPMCLQRAAEDAHKINKDDLHDHVLCKTHQNSDYWKWIALRRLRGEFNLNESQ